MTEAAMKVWVNSSAQRGTNKPPRPKVVNWGSHDNIMFGSLLVMVAFGLLSIYSASYPVAVAQERAGYFYVAKQACYAIFGCILMFAAMFCPPTALRKLSFWFMLCCIIALILTPFLGQGDVKRWIGIGPLTLQASEWTKIALILYGADLLSRRRHSGDTSFVGMALPMLIVTALCTGLVLAQPHLSGALMILISAALVCWFGGMPLRYFARCAAIVLLVMLIISPFCIKSYQWERLLAHFDPHEDPTGEDYQQLRARAAFIRGGIFGRGFCEGKEKQLYLPAAPTDFILSTIGEEGGLKFTLPVVLFYAWLVCYGFAVARNCRSQFGATLSSSITAFIAAQAAFSIAVNIGVIPTTGIPLPLISYGGNSLATTLLGFGLLFNTSLHRNACDSYSEAMSQYEKRSNDGYGGRRDRGAHISSHSSRRRGGTAFGGRKSGVRWHIAGA
ncbi:MAG: putative peptidoglycan glycosyltransferase FtsW [Armatimonadota bacterium]|nr:putative lipid II flippase FtsW [Armatimonadota bacterium]MCX7777576.1 putative lipid II flippase FtsW [Armatimonadota bacterium]MDW8025585.1 putative peptidoglycan glycosyltransferase FtsW [Armatimonadota bacterium]